MGLIIKGRIPSQGAPSHHFPYDLTFLHKKGDTCDAFMTSGELSIDLRWHLLYLGDEILPT